MADAVEAAAKDVHLVNSVIVDAFVQAVEKYSDGNTSWRQDFRHGLEKVAPLIIARHDVARLKGAPEVARVLNLIDEDICRDAPHRAEYWCLKAAALITAQAARIEALEQMLATERVAQVRGSNDAPGFEACVHAEIEGIRATLEGK